MDFDSLYEEIVAVSGSNYHAKIKPRMLYTWEKISDLISSDSTVVEIGIGPMSALVKRLKGAEVIGVDLVDTQSALCDAFGINLWTCDVQSEPLPLEDESVDVVLFLQVIEHLCMYPKAVLDEIHKKLKSGGYLVVSTVNFLRISSRFRVLSGKNPLTNYFERSQYRSIPHIREFVPPEMSYYMEKSGFSTKEIYRFGIPSGPFVISILFRLAYLYPNFRNYFMIIGKK